MIRRLLHLFEPRSDAQKKLIRRLHRITGLRPGNAALYELALTHRSASVRLPGGEIINNERLEFLGDAILDAIISEYLFKAFPLKDEGFLSKARARLVKRKNLNLLAEKTRIPELLISNTDNCNGVKYIYGDALEALIGAVYLDMGYAQTQSFVIEYLIHRHVDIKALIALESDYKSRIIEWAQKTKTTIYFESREMYQEDQRIPVFVSRVFIEGVTAGEGKGSSKKEAEQSAAEDAWIRNNLNI